MFRILRVSVSDDKHTGNGDGNGEHFVETYFVLQKRNTESVGEESRAIVDRCEITGGGQSYGDVPGRAGDRKGCGHEGRFAKHIGYRGFLGLGSRQVEVLMFDHLRRGSDDVHMFPPEGSPWCSPILKSQDEELSGPQQGP